MKVKFSMRGQEKIVAYLATIPRGVKIAAMTAYTEYMIGDKTHGLKYNPPQVEHDAGNPYKWQSEKQRRAFFATDGFGQGIPTKRTGETTSAWTMTVKDSNWTSVKVENDSNGAFFVQGDAQQRGHKADGWRKVADIVKTNTAGAMQKAIKAVNEWLKAKSK
jgi:hypothetical protein